MTNRGVRQAAADVLHVRGHLIVTHDGQLLPRFGGRLLAQLDVLLGRVQDQPRLFAPDVTVGSRWGGRTTAPSSLVYRSRRERLFGQLPRLLQLGRSLIVICPDLGERWSIFVLASAFAVAA